MAFADRAFDSALGDDISICAGISVSSIYIYSLLILSVCLSQKIFNSQVSIFKQLSIFKTQAVNHQIIEN